MTQTNGVSNGVTNGASNGASNGRPRTPLLRGHTPTFEQTFNEALARDPDLIREVVHNATTERARFLRPLTDPRRNLDDECGYPPSDTSSGYGSLNPELYRALYEREPMATRVVQLMPKESWQQPPTVFEDEDTATKTPFEEAWDQVAEHLNGGMSWHQDEEGSRLWDYLERADILSGIGHFGVLLVGIDDGLPLDQPVEGVATVKPPSDGYDVRKSGDPSQNSAVGVVLNAVGMPVGALEIPTPEVRQHVTWRQDSDPARNIGLPLRRETRDYADDPLPAEHAMNTAFVMNARRPVVNAATNDGRKKVGSYGDDGPSQGWGVGDNGPSGPAQYSSPVAVDGSAMGTDAQYVGVQLGPPSYPDDKPSKKTRKLLYLRPFDESLVQIVQYEANLSNPRFGQPVMYRVTLNDPREQHSGIGLPTATVRVHWSRVIHVADNLGSSEVFGVPRMRPVLNPILDCRKVRAASAEGYYKSCFTILEFSTHPQLGGDVLVDVPQTRSQAENVQNSLQRVLVSAGGTWKTLAPNVVDPTPHIAVHTEAICVQLACPIRVFKGAERGELASSQDDANWDDRVDGRRVKHNTGRILVPFVDRLIQMGVLPEPGEGGPAEGADELKSETDGETGLDPGDKGDDDEATPPQTSQPRLPGSGVNPPTSPATGPGGAMRKPTVPTRNDRHGRPFRVYRRQRVEWVVNYLPEPVANAFPPKPPTPGTAGGAAGPPKPPGVGAPPPSTATTPLPPGAPVPPVDPAKQATKQVDPANPVKPVLRTDTVVEAPRGYSVVWPDLDSTTDAERATTAAALTTAITGFLTAQGETFMAKRDYMVHVLGWTEEVADAVIANQQLRQVEMDAQTQALADEHGFKPAPPPGFTDPDQQDHDNQVAMEMAKNPAGPPGHGGQVGGTSSQSHTHTDLSGVKALPEPPPPGPGAPGGKGGPPANKPFPPKPGPGGPASPTSRPPAPPGGRK